MTRSFSASRIIGALLCVLFPAAASAFVELNTFHFSDSFNNGTATTRTRMLIDACLGFAVDKNSNYLVGWNYSTHSVADSSSSSTTYTSTQMGPRFVWFVTKSKSFNIGFAYNLVTKGSYSPSGGTAEEWSGTALKVDLGYNVPLSESWLLGLRLNYSSASYSSTLTNGTNYATASNVVAYIYPSIYTIYLF